MPANKLGEPCWFRENVDQAINITARTDEEGVDYFLASHAPVANIRHDETGEEYNEESLFQVLLNSKNEVLALIHGDPGTGKSHLIHWLKLRTEDALRKGELKKIVPVLIQRRTGTLKDALEQMIEQLGEDFKNYLTPVKQALSKISSNTAREKLVDYIGIELSQQQRADKKREPLPKLLKDLADTCNRTKGFRDWLCREKGLVNAVVNHLTENQSNESEEFKFGETLPQFTASELLPDVIYRRPKDNTLTVLGLLDEFEEDSVLVEKAAEYFNEVLPDAVKEMTGLSGTNLRDIFDRIRADLKKQDKNLALFIEDVSVMATLNEEIFSAVEPQKRSDLCRLIAVLGVTNQGYYRAGINLADNQKQRITHPISLGGKDTNNWQHDSNSVAKFAARYLNTVRLTREQISSVAAYRREEGADINLSACNYCPVRDECHSTFGKTQIGTVEVGLFPFSTIAPQKLLNDLSGIFAAQKNARGLLTQILLKALDENYENFLTGKFPNPIKFAVVRHEPPFWGPFKQKYCGGWSENDTNRLEFLAQGWVNAETSDQLATELKPFLIPFGFREFSKQTSPANKPTPVIQEVEKPRVVPKEVEPATNKTLNNIRRSLKSWIEGEKLSPDIEPRKLLAKLIRNSIAWNDFAAPPLEEWRKALGGASDDDENLIRPSSYAFIKIEGQSSDPATVSLFIDFPRNEETRNLIEAQAHFVHAGGNSWDFEHGEYYKRIVAQWLRRNQSRIVEQIQPPETLDTNVPVVSAVQILATAAIVRQRTKLPTDLNELLKAILTESWTERPFALSSQWKNLSEDLHGKSYREMLRFVTSELNVPQGRTGGINFINAIPALSAALDFANEPKIQIPNSDYIQGFWKGRYQIFQNKGKYADIADALQAEREAIAEVVDKIDDLLRSVEYETENLPDAVIEFCNDLSELVKAQTDARMPHPFQPFDELKTKKAFVERKDVWRTAVKTAQEVVADSELMSVLRFNPQNLKEAEESLAIAVLYVSHVEKDVLNRRSHFEKEGDPDILAESLLNSLEKIESMRS